MSIGHKEIKALAGFLGGGNFNYRDLQTCLKHMATAGAKHAGSMEKGRRMIAEAMPDKYKQQIAAILLKEERGRPNSIKPIKLLSLFRMYKNTEAPKKITDAAFAEWLLESNFTEMIPHTRRPKPSPEDRHIANERPKLTEDEKSQEKELDKEEKNARKIRDIENMLSNARSLSKSRRPNGRHIIEPK